METFWWLCFNVAALCAGFGFGFFVMARVVSEYLLDNQRRLENILRELKNRKRNHDPDT